MPKSDPFPAALRGLSGYAVAVTAVGAAVVGTLGLGPAIKHTPTLFFCSVMLSSWLGGLLPGIFASVLSSIAHELNQPLTAVQTNAQAARRLLAAERPELVEVKAALEDIIQDNARAAETIRNLRALFQRDSVQMSRVDLRQILCDVERIVRPDATLKNIALRLDLPTTLLIVIGNRTELIEVFMNLLMNAFESVCESVDGPREVVLRASQPEAGRIQVAVSDSGKGIEPEVMPRLFDAFFTTKSKGMGMGLAIVRSIIENHGGRLRATRNSARGATFEFSLPVKADLKEGN